ncbi:MAG: T9SS type A sorting domain-containing protein [Bacteroidota bacterium]
MKTNFWGVCVMTVLLFTGVLNAQVCNVDLNIKSTGVFPSVLPAGRVNVAYSQILQYYVTKDTMVNVPNFGLVNAKVDSLRIKQIIGVPNGMAYECNNGNCAIGGGTNGCILVTGTPTQKGVYPLQIVIEVDASVSIFKQTITDTLTDFTLTVNAGVGVNEVMDFSGKGFIIYPNPVTENVLHLSAWSNQSDQCNMSLIDAHGSLVLESSYLLGKGTNELGMNIPILPSGLYYLKLSSSSGVFYQKFFKQ